MKTAKCPPPSMETNALRGARIRIHERLSQNRRGGEILGPWITKTGTLKSPPRARDPSALVCGTRRSALRACPSIHSFTSRIV
jgi:hypothetical protein